jgi:serine/threonine protein kinase
MPRCPTCQSEYGDGGLYCPKDGQALLPMILEGRYRLLSPLGSGGMGVVYLAEHIGLGKRVAVKVLRGELSRDATFARRFELEAIAASQIGHENIVDVTDLGRTPSGELFYVMELLEGHSLSSLLRRERLLPLGRAVPILVQVCRALEAAHARGIVHRDVKPQNVMLLSREGRPDFVKVVDFGISKMSNPEGGKLTEAGAILGTANYMAPEQAAGGEVDALADVYALGVLTYELCTGTLPFHGENTFATMLQHLEAQAEPPSRRRPELGLPPELDVLVMQALSKTSAARPSMARFRAGLEALAPAVAPAPGKVEAALAADTASMRAAAPSRRIWPIVTGAAVLTAGLVALFFAWREPPAAPVSTPAPAPASPPAQVSAPPQEPAAVAPPPEPKKEEVPLKKLPAPSVRKPASSEPKKVQDLKPNPF